MFHELSEKLHVAPSFQPCTIPCKITHCCVCNNKIRAERQGGSRPTRFASILINSGLLIQMLCSMLFPATYSSVPDEPDHPRSKRFRYAQVFHRHSMTAARRNSSDTKSCTCNVRPSLEWESRYPITKLSRNSIMCGEGQPSEVSHCLCGSYLIYKASVKCAKSIASFEINKGIPSVLLLCKSRTELRNYQIAVPSLDPHPSIVDSRTN
jgi:hypothetical protein